MAAVWFDGWLRVFVVAAIVALATVALGPLPQITMLGAGALLASLLGALVCAIGLANYDPARWRELQRRVTGLSDSLSGTIEAIGEPRMR
ncbi:MAG TPA: hypothetical protein VGI14_01615 [Casimicrobiaceae bacterium]